jgi:hypothetical protein
MVIQSLNPVMGSRWLSPGNQRRSIHQLEKTPPGKPRRSQTKGNERTNERTDGRTDLLAVHVVERLVGKERPGVEEEGPAGGLLLQAGRGVGEDGQREQGEEQPQQRDEVGRHPPGHKALHDALRQRRQQVPALAGLLVGLFVCVCVFWVCEKGGGVWGWWVRSECVCVFWVCEKKKRRGGDGGFGLGWGGVGCWW